MYSGASAGISAPKPSTSAAGTSTTTYASVEIGRSLAIARKLSGSSVPDMSDASNETSGSRVGAKSTIAYPTKGACPTMRTTGNWSERRSKTS